jgi:hypothetical protein
MRSAFRQLVQLIPELNPRPSRSIEAELQRLETEAKTNPKRSQQLVAVRYYLQEVFRALSSNWVKEIGVTKAGLITSDLIRSRSSS